MTFPTPLHAKVAELVAGFFEHRASVDTVLLVNSIARGKATPNSDLDIAVLVEEGTSPDQMGQMEAAWLRYASASGTVNEFLNHGPYTKIHLDLFDGSFVPTACLNICGSKRNFLLSLAPSAVFILMNGFNMLYFL